jgi:adenosylcobinamide kinase / adenosylcobinamide-phosphate guanylyltransferase
LRSSASASRRWSRNSFRALDVVTGKPRLTLITGGARSGKSRYGESLIASEAPPWTYIATAEALDAEMSNRIADHRARRGKQWRTIEAPRDLPGALAEVSSPVLVDCVTMWVSNLLLADLDVAAETARLERVLSARSGHVVLISNEVGSGIVPANALGRRFRDVQGALNQKLAAQADRVVLVVCGLPVMLKGAA